MSILKYPSDLEFSDPFVLFISPDKGLAVHMYYPAGFVMNDGASYGNLDLGVVGSMMKQFNQLQSDGMSAGDAVRAVGDEAKSSLGNSAVGKAAIAGMMAKVAGGAGIAEKYSNVTLQSAGVAINPNTVLQFQNSEMRSYNFEFRMIPSSKKEHDLIQKIVKTFRHSVYAERTDTFLVKYPAKWVAIFNSSAMPQRTGLMFLTGVQTTYNPTGNIVHSGGGPNEIVMTLTFRETKSLTKEDIETYEGAV